MSDSEHEQDDKKSIGDAISMVSYYPSEDGAVGTTTPEPGKKDSSKTTLEAIRQYIQAKLNFHTGDDKHDGNVKKVIEDLSFDGVMKHWKENGFKNIVTMVGAGISTSAGIPDFRSPGSGLYHNLEKYNLPYPSAVFEMDYFKRNPKPFFVLAKELYPGTFKPTPCHYFVKLLEKKQLLLRHYTQNIDTLERVANISDDKLVEAHGTFYTNHCLGCRKMFTMEWVKEQIFNDKIPQCDKCKNTVKPDIVFFGESLPESFYELPQKDFKKCDLLIIMGTSLEVLPFASLIDHCKDNCVRLLINREKVGGRASDILNSLFLFGGQGLRYDQPNNTRDAAWIGNCDDGVFAITDALGWTDELKEMIKQGHKEIDEKNKLNDNETETEENKNQEKELTKNSKELTKNSKELTKNSKELTENLEESNSSVSSGSTEK